LPSEKGISPADRRSLSNFPIQGTAAEMTRLAAALATERGVTVCAMVHDALLIEADVDEIENAIRIAQGAMAEASRAVLKTLTLRSDCKAEDVIRYPDRYQPKKGKEMWDTVWSLIDDRMMVERDRPTSLGAI
jgi:hypothetical protein